MNMPMRNPKTANETATPRRARQRRKSSRWRPSVRTFHPRIVPARRDRHAACPADRGDRARCWWSGSCCAARPARRCRRRREIWIEDTWELIVDPFFDRGGIDKGLFWHLSASLQRVALGYALAAVVGVALGTLVGQSVWAMRGLDPIFQVLRTVPPLAWLPLSLAAFRDGQPSAIFVIFITAIWPIIINTAVGIRNIPQDYRNVAAVLRLNHLEFFSKIMVPAAAPYIFTGLRIGIGLSWLAIVAAEMLTGGVGIGFFIWDAWNSSHISRHHRRAGLCRHRRLHARPHRRRHRHHRHPRHRRPTEEHIMIALSASSTTSTRPSRAARTRPRCCKRHHARRREGRVRLDHRPLGLRQVHAAQHRRRPHAGRRSGGVMLENREVNEPGPRPRRRVPEPLAAAVAHRLRQRQARGRQGVRRDQVARRAPRLDDAQSRSRADGATPRTSARRKSPAA